MIEMNMYMGFVAGLLLLVFCGDALVKGASQIGQLLRISPVFVGVVVIGLGTSLPEILTTLLAGMKGEGQLAVGNVVGSNIANIGLILAIGLILFGRHGMKTEVGRVDYSLMLGATALFIGLAYYTPELSTTAGIILLVALVAALTLLVSRSRKAAEADDEAAIDPLETNWASALTQVAIGLLGLWLGAELLVNSAIAIATEWHVPSKIIGLTMVAIGTSLPELAATIAAAARRNCGLIIGNVLGSNLLNITAALGLGSLLTPLSTSGMETDMFVMALFAVVLLPLFIWSKLTGRAAGFMLLGCYVVYLAALTYSAT